LFRLFGIEVGLDYSWFLVFLLVIWSLTGHYLMIYQGWSTGFRLLLAVITAVLFFASVLAHEFGHSLVAIRTGVPVRRITLFIFGGVAQLTREPRRAPDEFLIAVAGPVVSLLLAGGFGALWLLDRFLGLQPATVFWSG
jgi:Zn-dependent protease